MNLENNLIYRYRDRGILIDTNILLLYFIGFFNPERIAYSKRLKSNGYTKDDYELLRKLIMKFAYCVTTPFILTEAYGLLNQDKPVRDGSILASINVIQNLKESQPLSSRICVNPQYAKFGITDTAIIEIGPNYLVLTDDLPLHSYLVNVNIDAINFTQLREMSWLNS